MARAINSYRDLVVWNEAMDLAEAAYRVSAQAYGLSSQIRRSAGSMPANIAEGYGRDSKGAYVQQLRVAQGSQRIRAHILLAERVGLIGTSAIAPLLDKAERVGKTLRALTRAVEAST